VKFSPQSKPKTSNDDNPRDIQGGKVHGPDGVNAHVLLN
jgi:hypothetical protein